jgi:hypothetical protein
MPRSNGESGTGKQGERKSEFTDDEDSAEEMFSGAGAGASTFLQCLGGINARCIPGGSGAGENTREGGGKESEKEDGNVEAQIGFAGQRIARHGGDEALEHSVADAHSECSAGNREDETFGKELAKDGAASRTECAANREFFLASHATGQQKIGNIDAGDEEDEADCA